MKDAEAVAARHIKASVGLPTFLEVPSDMPADFLTVERTGGGVGVHEPATFAIQCWAESRRRAAEMADLAAAAALDLDAEENFFAPSVESVYRFPDPHSRRHRYQVVVTCYVDN